LTERKIGKNLMMSGVQRITSRRAACKYLLDWVSLFLMLRIDGGPIVCSRAKFKIKPMTLAHLELADGDKLDTLQRLDHFREWQSLDERRYCLVCGNLITGWKIQVFFGVCPRTDRDAISFGRSISDEVWSQVFTYTATGFRPDCRNSSRRDVGNSITRDMISPTPDYAVTSDVSDEVLMQAITERRQSALTEFYSRHGGKLKSMIGNVVKEEGDADDVLQDIMIQVWREADRYSPKAGRPLGWISTIARRRAIDRVRRGQTYRRIKDRYAELHVPGNNGSPKPVTDEIARSDLRKFLNRQLRKLPAFQCQAVKLAFFKGMSHREIAVATRTPLGTVKTRLELGLRKLTQAMNPLRHKI
jgi:RNA polymerase sigma-70 factor, ECF subfamily